MRARPGSRRSCSRSTRRCSARRERDLRTGFTIPPERHGRLARAGRCDAGRGVRAGVAVGHLARRRATRAESGLPVVVKGVLTAEDARLACEHGAAAIVVSNHGGRQLDGVVGDDRRAAGGGGGGRRPDRGADRRRHPPRRRRREGARARRARRPGGPRAALGARGRRRSRARAVLELLRDEILVALQLVGCTSPTMCRATACNRGPPHYPDSDEGATCADRRSGGGARTREPARSRRGGRRLRTAGERPTLDRLRGPQRARSFRSRGSCSRSHRAPSCRRSCALLVPRRSSSIST